MSDEVDFLHADKHHNFLHIDKNKNFLQDDITFFYGFYGFGQACLKYSGRFIISL